MTPVTRWKHDALGHMTTEPDGGYVAYADHCRDLDALMQQLEQERHQAEVYRVELGKQCHAVATAEAYLATLRGLVGGLEGWQRNEYKLAVAADQCGDPSDSYKRTVIMLHEFLEKFGGKSIGKSGPMSATAIAALLDARRKEDAW